MRTIAVFVLSALILSPATLFAGKMELTTYYPAPYGEYKNINTTENTNLATTTGSVTVGTATAPLPDPKNDNTLILHPVDGDAAAQNGDTLDNGIEGSVRYSRDANGPGIGGLLYRNSGSWVSVGGGSGRITIAHDTSGWRGSATATCPAGGLIIQCGIGFSAGGTVPGAERAAASAFSGRFPDSPPPEFQPLPCPFNCLGSPSCTTSTGASSGYVALIVACS